MINLQFYPFRAPPKHVHVFVKSIVTACVSKHIKMLYILSFHIHTKTTEQFPSNPLSVIIRMNCEKRQFSLVLLWLT